MSRPRIRLLIPNDPHPMRIERDLANEIGLNESIVLLQLEYLIGISKNEHDGLVWTYHSLEDLKKNFFPWWSTATINRIIQKLESMELITIGNYNKLGYDRTQWYTLNEVGVRRLSSAILHTDAISQNEKSISQFVDMDTDKMRNPSLQNETTIPEITHKNTHEREPRAKRATPPPKQVNMNSFCEAVKIYKELSGVKNIQPFLIDKIADTVTDIPAWKAAIEAWIGAGNKKGNINGMLDWYLDPSRQKRLGAQNGYAPNAAVPPTVAAARQREQPSGPSPSLREKLVARQKAHEDK